MIRLVGLLMIASFVASCGADGAPTRPPAKDPAPAAKDVDAQDAAA